jgi:subtilisin family serine protease
MKRRIPWRSGRRVAAALATLLCLGAAPSPAAVPAVSEAPPRADAGLLRTLSRSEVGWPGETGRAPAAAGTIAAQTPVRVLVRGDVDPGAVAALGGRVFTRAGEVLSAEIPLGKALALTRLPGVRLVSLSAPLHYDLDVSVPAVHADTLRQRVGKDWTGLTGAGVVVGIVDSGLDVHHRDFQHPDGTTRVRLYWDQYDTEGPRPVVDGRTLYGTEWTAGDIDAGDDRTADLNGHGTHVAGIAAGNGQASQVDSLRYRYVGLAPNADLVIVSTKLEEANVIDAVNYVFARAEALVRPAVVNLSLGNQLGPHDGTGSLATALDALTGPGRLIVAAAGNAGDDSIHAEIHVPPGGSDSASVVIPSYVAADQGKNYVAVDAFYRRPDSLSVTVVSPSGARYGPIRLGEIQTDLLTEEGTVYLANLDNDPVGTNLEVQMDVSDFDPGGSGGSVPPVPGEWRLVFEDLNGAPGGGEVDLWIFESNPFRTTWTRGYDPTEEVESPAVAKQVVAVGSFTTKTCWVKASGETRCFTNVAPEDTVFGSVSFFTAHGPTRDGRREPEVIAPGFGVVSSLSHQITADLLLQYQMPERMTPDLEHFMFAGTSMSAPHVTGALGLLLQRDPSTDPKTALGKLVASARTDAFTGSGWGTASGWGKLDVARLVDPGLVPVTARVLRILAAEDGRPELRWEAAAADPVARFRLESRSGGGDWRERGTFDGPGPHRWVDPEGVSGTRYRLWAVLRTGAVSVWAEAVWRGEILPPRLVLGSARPNPTRGAVSVPFRLEGTNPARPLTAEVVDASGRRVRSLGGVAVTANGTGMVSWDGRDAAGRPAVAGLYWVRVGSGSLEATARVIRLP